PCVSCADSYEGRRGTARNCWYGVRVGERPSWHTRAIRGCISWSWPDGAYLSYGGKRWLPSGPQDDDRHAADRDEGPQHAPRRRPLPFNQPEPTHGDGNV